MAHNREYIGGRFFRLSISSPADKNKAAAAAAEKAAGGGGGQGKRRHGGGEGWGGKRGRHGR